MRDRKNWAILNAKVLVARFLTYLAWIRWVRTTPASVVEHCFSPPSWQEWMKFLEINWNWSLLLIAFCYETLWTWIIFIFFFLLFSDFIEILFSFSFFFFSFRQWRGTWHCSHMTGHMMWHHRPRTWWKNLEGDVRAHGVCMMALSKKWGEYEVEAWTIGQV